MKPARLQYTRTVALIIHEVLIELDLTNRWVAHDVRVHLRNFATWSLLMTFHNCSGDYFAFNATGLEKTNLNDTHETLQEEQFNAAALFGDLVALGIITHDHLVSVVDDLLERGPISSISQYRIIHLLVLRATFETVYTIPSDILIGWLERLLFPMQIMLPIGDQMVQRWILEICNLIEKANLRTQSIDSQIYY
ncbi:hypothetical protein CY34DRAFT_750462 [Suillus luteus UH-Slu-Lm8-n1]|uniref:Uncharacterized protein n=1 Tax=Suillus luteus UH-Slu-Lm8-n1 TaxID=930992 RepID=A0A0D0B8X0_9AGAM|nr:hypothetical protein CY34DRAFT_750462 [Suillus luteus UH-Slu-Lm8-n1]